MKRYDTIIIGAGHNGMVCAAYLAKHGHSVLLLEASKSPGGLAAAREFHPGFKTSVAHSVSHFPQKISRELDLESHGFSLDSKSLPSVGLSADGHHVLVQKDSVSGLSAEDSAAFGEYARLMRRYAQMLEPFWLKTMPRISTSSLAGLGTFAHIGLSLRRLGKKDMREFLRIVALPARDLMDEYFENDILKAMLSWDAVVGSKAAPRSPNNAVLTMLYRMAGEHHGAHLAPAGGAGGLIEALRSAAEASGAEFRTGAAVARVLVRANGGGLTAYGVELAGGERFEAERVVSSADPQRTFFKLVGVKHLEIGFTHRIRRLRCDGYVAKLHLALSGLPEFTGMDQPAGRMFTAQHMDDIEFAFDDAKYGGCSQRPVMEIVIPSMHDASLAPVGQHVLSAHVMYAPYRVKGGWDEAARDTFRERIIDTLARFAPGIREQIMGGELLTPPDLESRFNVTGGHWHHTEFALDQALMMRPTYQAAQYGTPLPGLYLCGAGCHPGGGITGGPGHNAAREILRRKH